MEKVKKKKIEVPRLTTDEYIAQFTEEIELGEETVKGMEKLSDFNDVPTFRCFKKLTIFYRGKYYMRP